MNSKKLLTVTSVAEILEVSPSTVYRLIKAEELSAIKIGQRQVRVQQEDLATYIEACRVSKKLREVKNLNPVKAGEKQVITYQQRVGDAKENQLEDAADSGAKGLSRRRFLRGSFGLVLAATANFIGGVGATLVYQEFAHSVEDQRQLQLLEQERLASIERLFGGLYSFSWSAGLTHLIQDYGITQFQQSSNVIASVSLGAALGLQGRDWLNKAIYTGDLPGPVRIDGDIIVVGSPTSDAIAKTSFEYSGARYELKRAVDPLIELPITYILDKEELGDGEVLLRRYVAGEEKEMYNWALRMGKEVLPPPKLGANQWLQTDYLLITRIPNLMSRKAFLDGAEILIIGGAHGTGTEAIGLLLKDAKLLSRIETQRQNAPYFQILVPIVEIVHAFDGVRKHTMPVRLGDPVTKPISVDIDRLLSKWSAPHT